MIKLLDEGAIPPVGVGAKRRIEEAIKSLAMADLEAGVYDLVIPPEGAEDE